MTQWNQKVTVPGLSARKTEGQAITMLTAYDASFAALLDQAGVDCVLVGDSLGNVIQGQSSTVPVTVDDVAYHVAAVRRGLKRALLIADLPFMSYYDAPIAMASAARLMQAGAEMVKLEGGQALADTISGLVANGVPVCGHLGLTPQHVHQLGGYRVQARGQGPAQRLMDDALALVDAGIGLLVLECVPQELAARVASALPVPVIGIGAGAQVDGQVLVLYDMLGIGSGRPPKFVRNFMLGQDSVQSAVAAYVQAVLERRFPGPEHVYD
ncbi:MAG: 3-methyl-2-oxobutanoate hydroxymethyltransferase [Wenzhouxiangella sp.]